MAVRHELVMPDLGIDAADMCLSTWLVEPGSEVVEGDRVVEILCPAATVDLPAPATGILVSTLVGEDEPVQVGDVLAVIEEV